MIVEIREINVKANMEGFGIPNPISGVLFGGEDQAHKFIVAEQSGEAFAGTVSAKFLRYADDQTVPLTGSIEDGKATVTLIENCYYLPGRFKLTIYVTSGGSTTAVYCCMGTVDRTDGRTTVDPSGEINLDVTDLINRINAAVGSIPPEYSALLATIAPTFSASTPYTAGEYVWYSGTLYRFTADHPAGAWVGTDATAAEVGEEISALKSAATGSANAFVDGLAEKELKTLLNESGYIAYNGKERDQDSYRRSGYIAVNKGDLISYSAIRVTGMALIAYYTAEKEYDLEHSVAIESGGMTGDGEWTSPAMGFVRLVCRLTELEGDASFVYSNAIYKAIQDKQIEVDKTLSVSDQAADAKTTGDKIAELKARIDDMTPALFDIADFANGNISAAGTPSVADENYYRVFTKNMQRFADPITVVIDPAFKVRLKYYSSSVMNSENQTQDFTGLTGEFTVPANQYFAMLIARNPEDTSLALPVQTAYNALSMGNSIEATLADHEARISALEESEDAGLPDYWQTEIESKTSDIVARDAAIGNAGDSFVFITDVHIPRNSMHSPALIKHILEHTSVDKVFFGGDMLDLDTGNDGKQTAEGRYALWNSLMYGIDCFFIVGNHDDNNYNNTNSANELTASELYGLTLKRMEKHWQPGGNTSYIIDNPNQKTRYIVLDCESGGFTSVLTWMKSKLTELTSGWRAVIMQHRYWGSSTSAVSTQGTLLVEAINDVYSQLNCEIVGVIVGHTHTDYNIAEETNGYPIIAVNCDTMSGSVSGYTRTAGTISEQSFDVVHIDYTNRKIYMTRIGAGSDREISF